MILTEENDKFLNDFKNKVNLEEISSLTESELYINFTKKNGTLFKIIKKYLSSNIKNFENFLKNIESIHLGQYQYDFFQKFNYNELTDLFKESKSINDKERFIPKTPILLYDSTSKILKKYLTNISNENIPFNELYDDIVSLLFYFKIPIINDRWIEDIDGQKQFKKYIKKLDEKKSNKSDKKKSNEDSNSIIIDESDSNKKIWEVLEAEENSNLNIMLKKIIAILVDLINIIKNKL